MKMKYEPILRAFLLCSHFFLRGRCAEKDCIAGESRQPKNSVSVATKKLNHSWADNYYPICYDKEGIRLMQGRTARKTSLLKRLDDFHRHGGKRQKPYVPKWKTEGVGLILTSNKDLSN